MSVRCGQLVAKESLGVVDFHTERFLLTCLPMRRIAPSSMGRGKEGIGERQEVVFSQKSFYVERKSQKNGYLFLTKALRRWS